MSQEPLISRLDARVVVLGQAPSTISQLAGTVPTTEMVGWELYKRDDANKGPRPSRFAEC